MEKLNRSKFGKKSLFISTFFILFFILFSMNAVSAFNFPTNKLVVNTWAGNLTNLSELQDVSIIPTDSQLLQYSTSDNKWHSYSFLLSDYWNYDYNDLINSPTYLSEFNNDLGIGNWTSDKPSYYTSTETNTQIINSNTSMKNYVDSSFVVNSGGDNLTGQYNYNGGWTSNGLSIINGDLYAQNVYAYNFSGLNVSTVSTNGSLYPTMDNQFDLGNQSYRWRDLNLGGNAYINGNVGIGTSTPAYKLDVNGNINIADGSYYKYGGSNALRLAKGTDTFYANTFVGLSAGNPAATKQTAIGYSAGNSSSGGLQTAVGNYAGYSNSGTQQTAVGNYAGSLNSGARQAAIGYYAGGSNTGDYQTTMGYYAGQTNTGVSQTAIGYLAGYGNTGASQTVIGYQAGRYNSGNQVTGLGYKATYNNSGDNVVGIGYQAGKDNTVSNQFIVKQANVNAVPLIQGDFATGNVGIGTATPQNKLNVIGLTNSTTGFAVGANIGITGTCVNVTYTGGIATSCND